MDYFVLELNLRLLNLYIRKYCLRICQFYYYYYYFFNWAQSKIRRKRSLFFLYHEKLNFYLNNQIWSLKTNISMQTHLLQNLQLIAHTQLNIYFVISLGIVVTWQLKFCIDRIYCTSTTTMNWLRAEHCMNCIWFSLL